MHQRKSHNKGKLSQDCTIQLEDIGFNWGAQKKKSNAEQWEERYNELAAYKEENDTCNVPSNQGALGIWVQTQRQLHKNGKLSRKHTGQLEGIRFVWKLRSRPEKFQLEHSPTCLLMRVSRRHATDVTIPLQERVTSDALPFRLFRLRRNT